MAEIITIKVGVESGPLMLMPVISMSKGKLSTPVEFQKDVDVKELSDLEKMALYQSRDVEDMGEYLEFSVECGFIDSDFAPLRCFNCGGTDLKDENLSYISSTVGEYDSVCQDCGKTAGHWAYGNWQP